MFKKGRLLALPLVLLAAILLLQHISAGRLAQRDAEEDEKFRRAYDGTDLIVIKSLAPTFPIKTTRTLLTLRGAKATEFVNKLHFKSKLGGRTGCERSKVSISFFSHGKQIEQALIWSDGAQISFERAYWHHVARFQPSTQAELEVLLKISKLPQSESACTLKT